MNKLPTAAAWPTPTPKSRLAMLLADAFWLEAKRGLNYMGDGYSRETKTLDGTFDFEVIAENLIGKGVSLP